MVAAAPTLDAHAGLMSPLVNLAVTLRETALRLEYIALGPRAVPLAPEVQRELLLSTMKSLLEASMLLEAVAAEHLTVPLVILKAAVQRQLREAGQQWAGLPEVSEAEPSAVVA